MAQVHGRYRIKACWVGPSVLLYADSGDQDPSGQGREPDSWSVFEDTGGPEPVAIADCDHLIDAQRIAVALARVDASVEIDVSPMQTGDSITLAFSGLCPDCGGSPIDETPHETFCPRYTGGE